MAHTTNQQFFLDNEHVAEGSVDISGWAQPINPRFAVEVKGSPGADRTAIATNFEYMGQS